MVCILGDVDGCIVDLLVDLVKYVVLVDMGMCEVVVMEIIVVQKCDVVVD